MDILLIKLGALGDVINTLPLAIHLKTHFKARIHWLVEPLSYPLIASHRWVDRAILFDKYNWKAALGNVKQQIRNTKFDVTLDLQRILKSGFFCLMAASRRRIGFDRKRCKEMTWLFPFERIAPADPNEHMLTQYMQFAAYLGIAPREIRWDIPLTDTSPAGLPDEYIVLNIGATKPANRWMPDRFAALADAIYERYHISCILTGGPEDNQRAAGITAAAKTELLNLVGQTSLTQLIAVIDGARLVVSCDTGPMHLAVALGKEVVALFGPANPRRTGPYKGHLIHKDLDCGPCNLRKRKKDDECMQAITPEDILAVLEGILLD